MRVKRDPTVVTIEKPLRPPLAGGEASKTSPEGAAVVVKPAPVEQQQALKTQLMSEIKAPSVRHTPRTHIPHTYTYTYTHLHPERVYSCNTRATGRPDTSPQLPIARKDAHQRELKAKLLTEIVTTEAPAARPPKAAPDGNGSTGFLNIIRTTLRGHGRKGSDAQSLGQSPSAPPVVRDRAASLTETHSGPVRSLRTDSTAPGGAKSYNIKQVVRVQVMARRWLARRQLARLRAQKLRLAQLGACAIEPRPHRPRITCLPLHTHTTCMRRHARPLTCAPHRQGDRRGPRQAQERSAPPGALPRPPRPPPLPPHEQAHRNRARDPLHRAHLRQQPRGAETDPISFMLRLFGSFLRIPISARLNPPLV